jgi:hypothetical protein
MKSHESQKEQSIGFESLNDQCLVTKHCAKHSRPRLTLREFQNINDFFMSFYKRTSLKHNINDSRTTHEAQILHGQVEIMFISENASQDTSQPQL